MANADLQQQGQMNKNSFVSQSLQLAMSFYSSGNRLEAMQTYRKILSDDPKNVQALLMLSVMAGENEYYDEAVALLNQAIKIKKNDPLLFFTLGFTLLRYKKFDEALLNFKKATSLKSDYIDAYNHMGDILKNQHKFDEAELKYKRSLSLKPDSAVVYYCLGQVLGEQEKLNEAVQAYQKAITLKPNYPEAYSNLGLIFNEQKKTNDAIEMYRKAISINPNYIEAHYNLGHALLTSGAFHEGWQKYEYRWKADTNMLKGALPASPQLPQWTGQNPQSGERLIIFGEQGLGDKLQFSRYIPLAADHFSGQVSIVIDRSMQSLFRRSFPKVEILDAVPANQSAWQWQCPLLSLPLAFSTTLENIPGQTPYLVPDSERVSYWKSKITALGLSAETRKIGIVWKPGAGMKIAKLKAISLQQLAPLLSQPQCKFFSLQKEPDPGKAPYITSNKLVDWSDELKDFDDTAALIMNLDMIISVDTSVAHLASGLGRPTWLLNRHASDWRWMHDREDSPWYPSIRIFTQQSAGDWNEVVKRVITSLEQ